MSSGTPYIGSKISLISKAKIRYEGFLYTIDSNDSTVTLAKVVSLGTEDRCPDHPVAAREEIFEYIVFRGTDIDDLHVCEAPKPQDPAIVHNGPVQAHQHNYHPPHHQHQGYSPFSGSMPPFGYPPYYSQKPQKPPSLPRTPTPPELAKAPGKEDKGHRYEQRDAKPSHRDNRSEKEHTNRNRRDRNDSQRQGRDNYHHDHKDNRYRDSYRRDRDNKEKETNKQEQQKKEDNKHRQNEDRRNEERRNEEERRQHDERRARARGGRGRGDNRQNQRNNQANRTKFTEDFDFESANAKFHKDEIQKELLRVLQKVKIKDDEGNDVDNEKDVDELEPLPTPEKYYDSSKSFFDNISCEAMQNNKNESSHDIMTRRQERTLNTETFGSSAANYRSYRHRGRGRGRGRGHFRSRGNFRGNSGNRSWVDYEFDYEAAGIKNHNRQVSASAGGS